MPGINGIPTLISDDALSPGSALLRAGLTWTGRGVPGKADSGCKSDGSDPRHQGATMPSDVSGDLSIFDRFATIASDFVSRAWFFAMLGFREVHAAPLVWWG